MEKRRHDNIYINRMKRSVIAPGQFGVRLVTASGSEEEQKGNGDAYLIDLQRRIFAVADSPDWTTTSSRQFLEQFVQHMDELFLPAEDAALSKFNEEILVQNILEHVNILMKEIDYFARTTFTCLFLLPSGNSHGLMLNCGDSCLFKIDLGQGIVVQMNSTDLHFVGRSSKIAQHSMISFDAHTRFLLTSDGIQALNRLSPDFKAILLQGSSQVPVEMIPDYLIDQCGQQTSFYDDVVIIALDPNTIRTFDQLLIDGGTDRRQERERESRIAGGKYRDEYVVMEC